MYHLTRLYSTLLNSHTIMLQMYQAIYGFASRTALELTVHEGDMLQIVQKHDTDGNTEWWLAVNSAGQRGYIPSNYVYKLE